MRLFELLRCDCALLGLDPNFPTRKFPLNKKNAKYLCILGIASIFGIISLFHEANTFQDYAASIYVSSTFMLGFMCYVLVAWKHKHVHGLINDAEKTINESELNFQADR